MKLIDLTNQKFGKLFVKKYLGNGEWLCDCDCGNMDIVRNGKYIRYNKNAHCGCVKPHGNTKHNHCYEKIYNTYQHMKRRCLSPQNQDYARYGGRGICICDEWTDKKNGFQNFYDWAMQNGYNDALTLDRIDVDGNYEPNNCRWVNYKTQQNNRSNNHLLTYNGITKTVSEWAETYKIPYERLLARIKNGWDLEKALTTPKMTGKTNFKYKENKEMNNVTIVGRLVRDPEVRYTQGDNATAMCRFTVAVSRNFKNSEGNYDSDFISCVSYGRTSEFVEKYFRKGDMIGLEGNIRTGSYTNKDGIKVYTTDVNVNSVEFVGGKSNNADAQQNNTSNKNGFANIPDGLDEEMPF